MSDATSNNSFGLGLTAINEMQKRKDYILDNIFGLFYQSELRIEYLMGYKNMRWWGYFPGYGSPGIKTWWNSCRNPGYWNYYGYGNYLGYGS